jgi:hypothetical protein
MFGNIRSAGAAVAFITDDDVYALQRKRKLSGNDLGLAMWWYFITVSPQPQPIKKLKMKITNKSS